jgi:hypothetical protein
MVPECHHILPSGLKCCAIAMRDSLYCYFHNRLHRRTSHNSRLPRETDSADPSQPQPFQIPILEDRCAIQLVIPDVLNALLAQKIDAKSAAVLLNGMRLAAQNADKSFSTVPTRTVEAFARTPEGHELAMTEDELDDRYEFDDGEITSIEYRDYPELPEQGQDSVIPLPVPAASAQSAETRSAAGEPAIDLPLVRAR